MSSVVREGGELARAYACDGEVPPLYWVNAPAGTVAYNVTLVELSGGVVWVAANLPASITSLPASDADVRFAGVPGCSPGPHRYEFRVQALSAPSPSTSLGGSGGVVSVERTVITGAGPSVVLASSTLSADLTVY